jgi:hypothetical protein
MWWAAVTTEDLPGRAKQPLLEVVSAARGAGHQHDLAAIVADVALEERDVVVGASVLDGAHQLVQGRAHCRRPLVEQQRVGA